MTVVIARLERDVVALVGPDARSFLQSLVSQDLDGLADGDGAHSLLLTPQGKLDVDFSILQLTAEELWLVCEGGFGEQLAVSLQRFKIRVKAEIEHRSDAEVLAVRGPDAAERARSAGLPVPGAHYAHEAWDDARIVRIPWPGGDGVDVVGGRDGIARAAEALVAAGAEQLDADGYEALRIGAGVPRQGFDINERTIPQEAFLELDAVSFTKGCFIGQELVCRIDTRGRVNKYLRRLQVPTDAEVPRGAEVVVDDRVVGDVTSAATGVALATVRREVEPPTTVTLRWDSSEVRAELLN